MRQKKERKKGLESFGRIFVEIYIGNKKKSMLEISHLCSGVQLLVKPHLELPADVWTELMGVEKSQ